MRTLFIDALLQDLKHGFRRLLRNPGFALAAVLSLALGIGANTAIFQMINAVRLRSLPVENPHELVEIKVEGGTQGFGMSANSNANATLPLWRELQWRNPALSLFAWSANDVRLGGTQLVRGLTISPQAFEILGVHAERGTLFHSSADNQQCDPTAAVISHAFWLSHFAGQDSAIGAPLKVDDRLLSVVGVTPRGFFGLEVGKSFDVALPLCERQIADPRLERKDLWWLTVMGRLGPNTTIESSKAQINALSSGLFQVAAPGGYDSKAMEIWNSFRLTVTPAPGGISRMRAQYESSLWLLQAIAAMVLLIACLNLANLLLAQANARESEVAVRLALGVGKVRLATQLMTENVLLAILGAAAGALIGATLSSCLPSLLSTSHDPLYLDLTWDWRTVAFTLSLTLLTSVVLGAAPVLRMSRFRIAAAIRTGSRSGSQQSSRSAFQGVLIGSQLALSLVLLVGAISFVRSFRSISRIDAGFREDGLVFCFADFSHLRLTSDRVGQVQADLLEAVRRTPGVESASTSTHIPLSGNSWTLGVKTAGSGQQGAAKFSWIGSGYFHTLGIPMLFGRDFTERDSAPAKKVMIVNETFAKHYGAMGTLMRSVAEPGYPESVYEIVGIVKDARYDSLRDPVPPVAYLPDLQSPDAKAWASISFRITSTAPSAIAAVRKALAERDPEIRTLFENARAMSDDSMARERLLAWLSTALAVLAVLLTCVGLNGVIAYIVSLRRSEIAVRMALGATARQIVSAILVDTAKVALSGIAAGLALAIGGGRFLQALLGGGLAPVDASTYASAIAALVFVSLLASIWPTLRATWINPSSALKGG